MVHALAARTGAAVRHPATIVAAALSAALGIAVLIHPSTWATFTAMAGGDKETLREMLLGFGVFAPIASIGLNVLQAVVAPVPGFVVPFVNGAVFGTWWGMLITWVGGLAAASAAFGIARTFGRRLAERICSQSKLVEHANRALERHAFGAIAMSRLVPGMPFDFFSYFVGLSRIRYLPFIAGTAVGSAPHAYLYAVMGSSLHVPLWFGVLLTPALGVAYGCVRWIVTRVRATGSPASEPVFAVSERSSRPRPAFAACIARQDSPGCRAGRRPTVTTWGRLAPARVARATAIG